MRNPFDRIKAAWNSWRYHQTLPLRLEFIIGDQCNLNCKGCTHYSPLARHDRSEFEKLQNDVVRVAKACSQDAPIIYIMGGETLLHPQICEIIKLMRQQFPASQLSLFTNGILLPRMKDEFWEECKSSRCKIVVTRYPVDTDYDKIQELVKENGVDCDFYGDRTGDDGFLQFLLDPNKKQNSKISHFKCYNFGCVSIRDGRIYPCSISACIKHLNAKMGRECFVHEHGDFIEISDLQNSKQILNMRNHAVPFCSYCITPPKSTKWEKSSNSVSEWVGN